MCILFFALNQHPDYPVIICANRDEFHQRPTQSMHYWQTPNILAGKDLTAGGTWLGLTETGRFSALTNFRQAQQTDVNKKSRGDLVIAALQNTDQQMHPLLEQSSNDYHGFNLVYGQLNNLHYFDSVNKRFSKIESGVHSLCNGALDDVWPKMATGQQQLAQLINSFRSNTLKDSEALNITELFNLMKNAQQAKTELLPNTGVGQQWEKFLSAIFIISPDYGTRTTTIITQNKQGIIKVADRSYNSKGECTLEQAFTLNDQPDVSE